MTKLALAGGTPEFADGVPFVRPPAPPLDAVVARLADSYNAGMLTNGALVRELEAKAAEILEVRNVVAVSSCTTGLMLVFRALNVRGDVLLPSFTFSASAHAVAWNGLACRFAEVDPMTFNMDLGDAKERTNGIGAILATHVFGAPCRPEEVENIGANVGVPVVFDVTHSLQLPGGLGKATDGQGQYIENFARAGVACGVDAVFMEVHDNPAKAPSDGPNQLPLSRLESLLIKLKQIHELVHENLSSTVSPK